MEKRTLGRTGLEVSVLGMGGLYVSSAGARGRNEACRAVHRALELGVNYVDTAPNYRDSEEVLGIALEAGPLPADAFAQLQEIADMVPFRPYEEPFGLPFGRPYKGPGQAGR